MFNEAPGRVGNLKPGRSEHKTSVLCAFTGVNWTEFRVSKHRQPLTRAFAHVVAVKRQALGLSKQELAARAGLHQTYIGLLERGERKPNLETAEAVAKALQVGLSELIREAETARAKS
jgi:ribosome-binding protein aMBF1 (putative translation factor)